METERKKMMDEAPSKAPPAPTVEASAEAQAEAPQPRMSDHCTNDAPLDASEVAAGEIVKLADVDVYVSKPEGVFSSTARLVLLLTGGTGITAKTNQIQADHFAREGYLVVMPDLFNGDSAPNAAAVTAHTENADLLETIKFKAAEGIKGFMIDMWLARHTPENTMPIIEKVLKAVKETYADKAYDGSMGVLAVGYCFGAKYVLRLAATDDIAAGAVAHGLLISEEDIAGVKKPVTLACVENDMFFPDEVRDGGRKHLQDNNIDHELKVYLGVPHGFAVYGSYSEEHIKTAQKQAFDQFLEFLGKH
ncbi:Alpha/Beta hydrolase protein [Tuber brumale]|nr:Alpha/Beta hydrolase protein [Tuber brumale]